MTTAASSPAVDVLLADWRGPFGGVPPFNEVRPDAFVPAFEIAIKNAEARIDAIANQQASPTFENTLVAMEEATLPLQRLETLFDVHAGNLNVGPIPDIERVVSPKLAAHSDWIFQNQKLFKRIEIIYQSVLPRGETELPDDAKRLLEEAYKEFVRRGAKLSDGDKAKLSQINARLARLFTDFSQNVLEEEKRHVTWIDDPAELAGLAQSTVQAMASAAQEKGGEAAYAVTNTRSSMDPFLTYADNRALREQVWRNYYYRADNDDQYDNKAIIEEILKLRAARADLLGYPSHAHWRLQNTMAAKPAAAMDLMMQVWPHALDRVAAEVADMQALANRQADAAGTERITILPWDYRYYAEKVRKEKYDLDMAAVRPYLQLDRLVQSMFWAGGELFGYQFEVVTDVPVFHPDVNVYQVTDRDGEHVALFYLDPFAREGKRSGAWMTDYREQSGYDRDAISREVRRATPIVSNNSNFVPGPDDQPALISWDDAVTLFHEFGHALHGLSSEVRYRSQSGTNVARDFVEFPSQLNEHWLSTDQVLGKFATHVETGQPLPDELLKKIEASETFNSGFETVEYLACAILDMKLHQIEDGDVDIDQFEKRALQEIGMPDEIPLRHRLPHFSHLFSSDSYSAGYYSYLWSDALTADAAEMFEQAGGYYDGEIAKKYMDNVLSVGDTRDPGEAYRAFRGRDVDTAALLRKKGFKP